MTLARTAIDLSPDGLVECLEALGNVLVIRPDGVYSGEPDAVSTFASSYSGSPEQLAWHKSRLLESLSQVYLVKFASGFAYKGHLYQIDPASQFNIAAKAQTAALALNGLTTWPADFYWITADNAEAPLTASEMLTLALAVGSYVTPIILRNRTLKNAITAAPDMAALDLIDINAGWPQVNS